MCDNPWEKKIEQLEKGITDETRSEDGFELISLNEGFDTVTAYFSSNKKKDKKKQDWWQSSF